MVACRDEKLVYCQVVKELGTGARLKVVVVKYGRMNVDGKAKSLQAEMGWKENWSCLVKQRNVTCHRQ